MKIIVSMSAAAAPKMGAVSIKMLNTNTQRLLKALCDATIALDIGTNSTDMARDILKRNYSKDAATPKEAQKAFMYDVKGVVNFYGGDCKKTVGTKIINDVQKAFE